MADDFVQVAPDNSAGKKIDNTTVTTTVGTVERQRVSIGDAIAANSAAVSSSGALSTMSAFEQEILFELRRQTLALQLLCIDHGIQIDEGMVT